MVQANLDPDYALAKDLQSAKDRLARLEALLYTASAGGGGSFTVSATAPTSPTDGAGWYNLTNGYIFFYVNDGNSSQWVQDTSIANDSTYAAQIAALQSLTSLMPVSNGGTGASSLTSGGYLKGNGTSAVTSQTGIPGSDIIGYMSPNYIINGAFDFWQRGTSFTNPAGNTYTADRWRNAYDGTGGTVTISQQTFTPGAAPVAGYEAAFFTRIARSVAGTGGTYNIFSQPIEDVRTLAGQTATVSFWAKADAARSVVVDFEQRFGSGGSGSVVTSAGTASVTTAWQRFSFTVAVPSISGKTVGANSSLNLRMSLPLNTVSTVDVWGVQVEQGSVATAFRRNANSVQGEFAACQRYYQISSYQLVVSGGWYSDGAWNTAMRTSPTINILARTTGTGGSVVANGYAPTTNFTTGSYSSANCDVKIEGVAEL